MECVLVDYVWIGGNGELRSKTRVLTWQVNKLEDIPIWNYDGSSTNQATSEMSEVYIYPRRIFRCPFRRPNGLIAMCDTYTPDGIPLKNNYRNHASTIFDKYADQKVWFGLEQEYFIYDTKTNYPVGFDPKGKQGQYYCSVGGNNAFCRNISEEHLEACIYAGIKISGTNIEVAPGQHEFQIGPVEGIDASDQLWVARYILEKISEHHGKYIVFLPKPLKGNWNGSGCHINVSTENMRKNGGLNVIYNAISKLGEKHAEYMKICGEHNEERMTGTHETSSYDKFTFGIANRSCSIRIPMETYQNKKGYFEDRRPAANCDPYLVTSKILEIIMN